MKKEILIVKNHSSEGPGLLETVLTENKLRYNLIDLDQGDDFPPAENYGALVVLGGPDSANDKVRKMEHQLKRISEALAAQIPYIGICLGLQVLIKAAGGEVVQSPVKEVGFIDPEGDNYRIKLTQKGIRDPLFKGLQNPFDVFQLHGETVQLTSNMILLGVGRHCRNQVVKVGTNAYGIQCHFELTSQMLNAWADEVPDLLQLNNRNLQQSFDTVRDEYTRTGRKLFNNFLRIAELIA